MAELYDFWEWEVDWAQTNLTLYSDSGATTAIGGEVILAAQTDRAPSYRINLLNMAIKTQVGNAYGARFRYSGLGRPDRFIEIYGPALESIKFTGVGYLDFGFTTTTNVGSEVVAAPLSYQGAFAAPYKHLIFSKDDPIYEQSMSFGGSGPPTIVNRAKRRCHRIMYKYLPGAVVFKTRLNREILRDKARLEEDDTNYAFENCWEVLRSGNVVQYCQYIEKASSSGVDFGASFVPFGTEYTDDYDEVYLLDEAVISDLHQGLADVTSEFGSDAYSMNLEVFSDDA